MCNDAILCVGVLQSYNYCNLITYNVNVCNNIIIMQIHKVIMQVQIWLIGRLVGAYLCSVRSYAAEYSVGTWIDLCHWPSGLKLAIDILHQANQCVHDCCCVVKPLIHILSHKHLLLPKSVGQTRSRWSRTGLYFQKCTKGPLINTIKLLIITIFHGVEANIAFYKNDIVAGTIDSWLMVFDLLTKLVQCTHSVSWKSWSQLNCSLP